MSLLLTGGVAAAYASAVIGVHRWTVYRRRQSAEGYRVLDWLDWDTLLSPVLPAEGAPGARVPAPPQGGPAPALRGLDELAAPKGELLRALVGGAEVDPARFLAEGFSGGEARWLSALALLRSRPLEVLRQLQDAEPRTPAEAYLREALVMNHEVTAFNLELTVFSSKWRVSRALTRFGEHPALYFVRARISGRLGFTGAVLDDLARAVYFSRESDFYLDAVMRSPWIDGLRPSLAAACRQGLARRPKSG